MTVTLTSVRSYLIPPAGACWQWSRDGDAIEWCDGPTVVFREELAVILRRVVTVGLPPLGPMAVLLSACRDSWTETVEYLNSIHEIVLPVRRVDPLPDTLRIQAHSWVDEIVSILTRIHNWPTELRSNLQAKAELVATVFETNTIRTSPAAAAEIVDALADGISGELLEPGTESQPTTKQLFEDLRILSEGLRRVDADKLRLRLETGLEQHIVPAETDEPISKKIRSLFSKLENNDELAGMVRLARDLMAIVHLPRPLDQQDDIPVGGISDISNRGTLDKLLISELAQDDETLMMRVAMNEAMYLRRETPPKNPPRSRHLILDSGIRMWGVPRVFATSVALSLAAVSDPSVQLQILRPEQDRLLPIDISTRKGLVQHLKQLHPEAHPGQALPDLVRHVQGDIDRESDTVLITTDDVLTDHEFRRALADCEAEVDFIITVKRDGRFRLMQRTMHGMKVLKEALLDLAKLLDEPNRPTVSLVDSQRAADLPAICRLEKFPLRLSHHVNPRQTWWVGNDGVLSITNDRRLMYWDQPFRAALQIADRLPTRELLWSRATPLENGSFPFVVGNLGRSDLTLVHADLHSGHCELMKLATTESPIRAVCDHAGVLFVIDKKKVDAFDTNSGECLKSTRIPSHITWFQYRFFRSNSAWLALSYDGTAPCFEEVMQYAERSGYYSFVSMFDAEGIQGPVAISSEYGLLYYTAQRSEHKTQARIHPHIRILAIARNGCRVALRQYLDQSARKIRNVILNSDSGEITPFQSDPFMAVESSFFPVLRPRNIRNRFHSVGIRNWRLLLESGSGELLRFEFDPNGRCFRLSPADSDDHRVERLPFCDHASKSTKSQHGLRVATFKEGSKIFLDSRGLLHLKSADRNIAEVTFVLSDFHDGMAWWCSNGTMAGSEYHLGDTRSSASIAIWDEVLTPFMKKLQ